MPHIEEIITEPKLSVKRFYALEYFFILLESLTRTADRDAVFNSFLNLKQEYRLGESKFKKMSDEPEELTPGRESRYRYTFKQVIEESKQYGLISEQDDGALFRLEAGDSLLKQYGTPDYHRTLFKLMERDSNAFRYLIERMFAKSGLLIFPVYSPYQLGFERRNIRTTGDIERYAEKLSKQITSDVDKYLGTTIELGSETTEVIERLRTANLLSKNAKDQFQQTDYNSIVSRIRKFWLIYFLQNLYGYKLSLSSFDMWIYRGKQCGVIQATEFYPNFNGRIVYPTSVVVERTESADFSQLIAYKDGKNLYLHEPTELDEKNQDKFIKYLVEGYHSLRRTRRGYFVNLASLRELVCFNLKVSEHVFERMLNQAYKHNLAGELPIKISLEVDRLPEETGAEYLKRVPVLVDGKPRNIISIDEKGTRVDE